MNITYNRLISFIFVLFIINLQAPPAMSLNLAKVVSLVNKADRADELADVGRIFRNADRFENSIDISEAARYVLKASLADEVKQGAYLGIQGEELVLISVSESVRWMRHDYVNVATYVSLRASSKRSEIFKLFVEEDVFFDKQFPVFATNLPQNIAIVCVLRNGRLASIRLASINGSVEPLFSWGAQDTLFIHVHNDDTLSAFAEVNLRRFNADDVRLVGLFDSDANHLSVQALRKAVERRGVKGVFSAEPDLNDFFKAAKGRLVLVVGHTENSRFVVRGPDNSVKFNVSISELEEMQKRHNTSVLLIGCETGLGGSLTTIHSLNVAQQLDRALGGLTYGDFFAALGTPESPFVVTSEQIKHSLTLVIRRMEMQKQLEASISIRTVQALRFPEPPVLERTINFMSALIENVLAIVIFVFLLLVVVGLSIPLVNLVRWLFQR